MKSVDFSTLSPAQNAKLWQNFCKYIALQTDFANNTPYQKYQEQWQKLNPQDEYSQTEWLIDLFNALYQNTSTPTILVRGENEPEYFASKNGKPARIEFAHGFFQSALHEISHWCVAGARRRGLDDFGYWYCPDGRDETTQRQFEQVEIKPQAIECLLSLALGRYFYVSADNLNANFDTSNSTFATDVYDKAQDYLYYPHTLSTDARRLIWVFFMINNKSNIM